MLPKLLRQYDATRYPYGEENQERPCRFAFATQNKEGNFVVEHYPVLCRDFLNDTLVWKKTKTSGTIYGYSFRGKITTKRVCLMMDNYLDLEKNIHVLNEVEESLGISKTYLIPVDDVEKPLHRGIIVIGSKWWMKNTVLFSWYTTVLRLLTNREPNGNWELLLDHWAKFAIKFFWKIPAAMKEAPDLGFSGFTGTGRTMHDYNGWAAQFTANKVDWVTYGEYLRGKFPQT